MIKPPTKFKNIPKILLIRFSSIGDIILTTPLIKKIREDYPDARIDYLTLEKYSELLRDNPHINRLHIIDSNMSITELIRRAKKISELRYNYIFDLHRSLRSAIFRLFIKSERRFTLNKHYLKRFLLVSSKISLYKKPYSVVNRYFKTARGLNLNPDVNAELWISRRELNEYKEKIDSLFSIKTEMDNKNHDIIEIKSGMFKFNRSTKIISMMPFATWQTKEWGEEKFIELGRRILGENATILIHGGKGEERRGDILAGSIGVRALSIAGKASLLQSAVFLSISDCLVTNDTGIMHIGGAVKIPVIAIFGSTTEELGFFPYRAEGEVIERNLNCRPCTTKGLKECPKGHFRCMNDIPAEEVFQSIMRYI